MSVERGVVSTGGKLPYSLEVRSAKVLDILSIFIEPYEDESPTNFRKRLQQGLYRKSRPGFYHELTKNVHLAYADQRDGHGSQHYWRIFYNDESQKQIEALAKSSSLTINASRGSENAQFEWGGLYLRSPAELVIAKELEYRQLLFFANVRGRVSLLNSPLSEQHQNGRVELDFLVFYQGKCRILEIDGIHHNADDTRLRDYSRDRLMLKEGIPTARFSAQECLNGTADVVNEFLTLF